MKFRLIVLLLVALTASSIATAQAYQIRVNRGLNLRADSSLQSRVVDTVRSGDILQVIGSANNWLEIDRNGRIVWLANWTDYSRVGETTQPVQQTSAPIDNCCFVDRQCSSEGEWTDGYWAFQHGQCPAPPQPAISLPIAPSELASRRRWGQTAALAPRKRDAAPALLDNQLVARGRTRRRQLLPDRLGLPKRHRVAAWFSGLSSQPVPPQRGRN